MSRVGPVALVMICAALVLAGCGSTPEEQITDNYDEHCQDLGTRLGTEDHADCRVALMQLRQQEDDRSRAPGLAVFAKPQGHDS